MEDASSLVWSGPGRRALLARVELTAAGALAILVGASFVVRTAIAWLRATPILFQDEYLYAQVGRSIATTGKPPATGAGAHFPALLQPLLTAPAWLFHDVGTAYRIVQAIDCLAMSLAAVPLFLLARRVGLAARPALAVAALGLLVPDTLYSSFVLSEPVAYPALLAAVAAGVAALDRPVLRNQLLFAAFSALAITARIQFAVLPLVYVAALLTVGIRERRVRPALREQVPLAIAFGIPFAALLAAALVRGLGVYSGLLAVSVHPIGVIHWASLDAMGLLYASGWALVPGAILGLLLGLTRARTRAELAFAAMTALLLPALLLPAGLVQADAPGAGQIQERYVFYAVPLLALGFALYARRGWPHRAPHFLLAVALVAVSARVPLAGYAAVPSNNSGSPVLHFVYWLEQQLGAPWLGSIALAAVAAIFSAIVVAGSFRPRFGTPAALILAACLSVAVTVGATRFELRNSSAARFNFLPADAGWVDRHGLRHVALLQSYGGDKTDAFDQLFWSRSTDRVLLLPAAAPFERFQSEPVRVAPDGTLLAGARPVNQPLLVDESASTVLLRGARAVGSGPTHTLWVPQGWPRLSLYLLGRYANGWLADRGRVMLWPVRSRAGLSGRLSFVARLPKAADPTTLTFLRSGMQETVHLKPGTPTRVSIRVCSSGSWSAFFRSSEHGFVAGLPASVQASAPTFVPDGTACAETTPAAY